VATKEATNPVASDIVVGHGSIDLVAIVTTTVAATTLAKFRPRFQHFSDNNDSNEILSMVIPVAVGGG